jgi:glutathione S-transferase
MMTLYAFAQLPPFAQGLARDLRVRWALEEAGLPYRETLIRFEDLASPDYRALQPFGQVPAIEEDGFSLFESGAIVGYIGERSEGLLPKAPKERARCQAWMFAALNSVEPPVQALVQVDVFFKDQPWAAQRRPSALDMVGKRLAALETRLHGRDWLEDRFTAGDLLMTTVLRMLRHTDLVSSRPALKAYQARCEARPAFQKALADHMRPFAAAA